MMTGGGASRQFRGLIEIVEPFTTIEPCRDIGGVEPDKPSHRQAGHSPLDHETADMATGHPQPLGELVDGSPAPIAPDRRAPPRTAMPCIPSATLPDLKEVGCKTFCN